MENIRKLGAFSSKDYQLSISIFTISDLGVTSKKNNSIFKDIIQTKVDHPPSYPNFDKLFFDNFLVGRAPTLPTEFLTKDSKENCILSIFMHEI